MTSIARSAVHQAAAVPPDPPAAPGFSPTYGTASARMPTMTMIATRAQQVAAMADARARDGFALVALDGMGGSGKSSGRGGAYRRYDWETGTLAPGEIHTVPRSGIVVVEGVYAARPELADHYDLLVYVDTPREESMRRLRARGHDHGPIDWESRWRLAEEHYLATTRPRERAHLVVPGD
ncbi:hypothetical protein [Streptomyces sp. NPDC060065]|uniref:hypothetical protein n=1 Tax=Streptomyces sp. NPDC060065 TaxID=3347050 RepID=UPI00368BAA8B